METAPFQEDLEVQIKEIYENIENLRASLEALQNLTKEFAAPNLEFDASFSLEEISKIEINVQEFNLSIEDAFANSEPDYDDQF